MDGTDPQDEEYVMFDGAGVEHRFTYEIGQGKFYIPDEITFPEPPPSPSRDFTKAWEKSRPSWDELFNSMKIPASSPAEPEVKARVFEGVGKMRTVDGVGQGNFTLPCACGWGFTLTTQVDAEGMSEWNLWHRNMSRAWQSETPELKHLLMFVKEMCESSQADSKCRPFWED